MARNGATSSLCVSGERTGAGRFFLARRESHPALPMMPAIIESVFDHHLVGNDPGVQAYERLGPDSARLVVASLTGAAQRYANWHEPTEAETAAAVTELWEIIGDRTDGPALLAEIAGLLLGAREGALDEAKARGAADFCIAAGADQDLVPHWAEEGRRRAKNARRMPHSGRPRLPPRPLSSGPA
jgi:hypothetical protein